MGVSFWRLSQIPAEPDIVAAGFTTTLPVGDTAWGARFFVELPDGSQSPEPALFHFRRVSPGYRETMGIPLPAGATRHAGRHSTQPVGLTQIERSALSGLSRPLVPRRKTAQTSCRVRPA